MKRIIRAPTKSCLYIGLKAAIALEELVILRASKEEFVYEPHTINIRGVENKKPDFLEINPNGKVECNS